MGNKIIDFVNKNSLFTFEGEENGVLQFSKRTNGDKLVDEDVVAGTKLKKQILDNFNNINVKIEIVDEWVLLFVSDVKEPNARYRYTFIKNIGGQGFSKTFNDMDELIEEYGDWIEVDWKKIKEKVEIINKYPNDDFNGWVSTEPLLIKRAKEDGNTWGYNFYIKKSKEKE